MFGFKRKWLLVKTEILDGLTTKTDKDIKLFIYLYESNDGKRREEHKLSLKNVNDDMTSISYWWSKVYPWLQGTNFPDIPTYWQACADKQKDDVKEIYKRMLSY